MIHFHFITLFPQAIETWLNTSILGRAKSAGVFDYALYQLRDYAEDRHKTVDDLPYGGGGGMILKIEPLVAAVESIWEKIDRAHTVTVHFSPGGKRICQELIDELTPKSAGKKHFIMVCGHYEGMDQRFIDHWIDYEISLGDFVLTGGELPAVALSDALIRQQENTLGYPEASQEESFRISHPGSDRPLLEYPQYTRPAEFQGFKVPDILLSGNHEKVRLWRMQQALRQTQEKRPELLNSLGSDKT